MHGFALNIVLNHSVLLAAFASVIRFRMWCKKFLPFIFFIWLGLINETISLAFIYTKGYNTFNSNIYVLFESAILFFQFYKWKAISQLQLYALLFCSFFVWLLDNLIWHNLYNNNSVFRITYSLAIIGCSFRQVNLLLACEKFSLLRNPVFLICFAFIFYYSLKIFIEVFNACHPHWSQACCRNIFTILYTSDFISNIMYTIALLCLQRKPAFTMQY